MKDEEQKIYFRNYERIPAERELDILIRELKSAGFQVGEKRITGLVDLYECKKDHIRFDIIFTGEESFVYSDDKEAIKILMELFK